MGASTKSIKLLEKKGSKASLLGNNAIVRGGLEAGVQFFSCYPGTPSSEVADTTAKISREMGIEFEYSVNEKIAVEIAYAASLAGARSMCSMKHLGLMSAGDPVSTMPYVGVEAGMVIVSAGDPSCLTSPNEQDQRHLNKFLYYPIFDPATADDALQMTKYAFEFSEKTRLPVIMRPTTRVCHSTGMVEMGDLPSEKKEVGFTKNPQKYVPIPVNARRMRVELTQRMKLAEELLGESNFFPRSGSGKKGIIASGVAYTYAHQVIDDLNLWDSVCLQQIGAYPIPEKIIDSFCTQVDDILVVEELTPFVEEWVSLYLFKNKIQKDVFGKLSNHFPWEFESSPELAEKGIRAFLNLEEMEEVEEAPQTELPARPPVLCPGCPHRTSFHMVNKVFGKKTVYCNDIGCYTLGYGEPLNACDMLLCMGSSISQASGISRVTKKRTVAYIGDSTFFHSGLPALANAVQANDNITVVILDNYITAMTGFQPSLTSSNNPDIEVKAELAHFSIEDAVKGVGVKKVHLVDPFNETEILTALKDVKNSEGVNVVICNSPCVIHKNRITKEKREAYQIDQELCTECSLCVRQLGCPAILVVDGVYTIDEELCDGCDLCARGCHTDAISIISKSGEACAKQ
ncbi:MAG: indolepyruvate ferredoxin oxidoreductase subunit alpha [Bacteriovoracaceae bacterium]|jgi:indolepyruvate ferredoxin oxidoreductase, alpha subunit|nr:indolepyruvate ferredoxin oxidoreductase subunit alpha [Bacteriovoracaceae bacterium]